MTIESYTEIIACPGAGDPTIRAELDTIFADDLEHAEDRLTSPRKVS
jgi:hypothetical protein